MSALNNECRTRTKQALNLKNECVLQKKMLNFKNEYKTLNKLRPKRTNVQHKQNEC